MDGGVEGCELGVEGGLTADEGRDRKGGAKEEGEGGVDEVEKGLEWVCGGNGAMHLGSGGPD
ncbi:hypothetical protein C1H46_008714 [Malus baccata]|uniref:Uncharacterized protein n=1 Tax=Malus baccata TaxID=106549 RepID=A0A540N3T7_MALBA|nr:hypothetical protein C1H46_008714 [Malus baccata]